MRILTVGGLIASLVTPVAAQRGTVRGGPDPLAPLIARLDFEKYKTTSKGLTQFGDRRAGTADRET